MKTIKQVSGLGDSLKTQVSFFLFSLFVPVAGVHAVETVQATLPFTIPTLSTLLTFIIRFFFAIAGLAALLYLLLGALGWITSGGSKEGVEKAREKIQAAIIGVILIVLVLALIWTLEQVIFSAKICFGLSCPLSLPSLIQ